MKYEFQKERPPEQRANRIHLYLFDDDGDDDNYSDVVPESNHDEEYHVSESNHHTDSLTDDSDADPDYIPGSGETSVVEDSDVEEDNIVEPPAKEVKVVAQEAESGVVSKRLERVDQVVSGAVLEPSTDMQGTVIQEAEDSIVRNHVDDIINAVVSGAVLEPQPDTHDTDVQEAGDGTIRNHVDDVINAVVLGAGGSDQVCVNRPR